MLHLVAGEDIAAGTELLKVDWGGHLFLEYGQFLTLITALNEPDLFRNKWGSLCEVPRIPHGIQQTTFLF